MKKEDKGKFEETVRSKLYNFESNINPEDWKRIVAGLSAGKTVDFFSRKKLLAVAASIAILSVLAGGLYYFNYELRITNYELITINDELRKFNYELRTDSDELRIASDLSPALSKCSTLDFEQNRKRPLPCPLPKGKLSTVHTPPVKPVHSRLLAFYSQLPTRYATSSSPCRRWGVGIGGGQIGVSSNTGSFGGNLLAPNTDYAYMSTPQEDQGKFINSTPNHIGNYGGLRSFSSNNIPYTNDIKHRMPVSLGLGASYYLNDRWTLQSGLVYSMLRSDWSIDNVAWETDDYTQRLHFIGVPLSASYKLGQWKRLRFHASAGGMVEYNVAGKMTKTTTYDNEKFMTNISLKMKEPYFSINTKINVSYPVWRFIGVYAETGVSYYFDNGSHLKTIRSDKPFNVSLQAGISLGF